MELKVPKDRWVPRELQKMEYEYENIYVGIVILSFYELT